MTNKKKIDALLNSVKAPKIGQRCKCCKTPEVKEILDRWVERHDDGEQDLPTLRWVHEQLLVQHVSFGSMRNHLTKCLNRDPITGDKKDGE